MKAIFHVSKFMSFQIIIRFDKQICLLHDSESCQAPGLMWTISSCITVKVLGHGLRAPIGIAHALRTPSSKVRVGRPGHPHVTDYSIAMGLEIHFLMSFDETQILAMKATAAGKRLSFCEARCSS